MFLTFQGKVLNEFTIKINCLVTLQILEDSTLSYSSPGPYSWLLENHRCLVGVQHRFAELNNINLV